MSSIKLRASFFTEDEVIALRKLGKSYKQACAETLFTANEIKALRTLMKSNTKQTTTQVIAETGMSYRTAKNALDVLKQNDKIESQVDENDSRKVLWWYNHGE